jgi:hypothetical protein
MEEVNYFMDRYSLFARINPVLIFILPIIIIAIAYSFDINSYLPFLSSIGLSIALAYFVANISRELGKKKERELWNKWGGIPTSQILCYENNIIDKTTKNRYHYTMMSLIKETSCDDIQTKNKDEQFEVYKTWTKYIIEKTRDIKKYPLIFKENIAYGFRRNLWAMKNLEVVLLLIAIVGNYLYNADQYGYNNFRHYPLRFYISEFTLFFLFFIWIFVITKEWIKIQAFTYAERLMEAIDSLLIKHKENCL